MTRMVCGGGVDVYASGSKIPSSVNEDDSIQKKVLKLPRGVNVGRVIGSDGQMMYWIDEKTLAQRLDAAGIVWKFED